jgi:hypothetical protein
MQIAPMTPGSPFEFELNFKIDAPGAANRTPSVKGRENTVKYVKRLAFSCQSSAFASQTRSCTYGIPNY